VKTVIATFCAMAVLGAATAGQCASYRIDDIRALKRLPVEEIKKLAEAGDARAEAELGARYGLGAGVPKDYGRAIELLRNAAAKNDPDAQYYLGTAFSNGTGVARDNTQASLWYELAAGQHHPGAEYVMANLIGEGGAGIGRSPTAAMYYLWDSAVQGYEPAEAMLGYVFHSGAWIDANPRAAAYWYRRALSRRPDRKTENALRALLKSGAVDIEPGDPEIDTVAFDPTFPRPKAPEEG
jgi:TPR repeat protein